MCNSRVFPFFFVNFGISSGRHQFDYWRRFAQLYDGGKYVLG